MILQQLDYLEFLDFYHDRVRAFHVKDAEFRPNGRSGVYGGYQDWIDRAGRFRSLGDGQIDFKAIFSKMAQYDYPGWAVLEWECCIKHPKAGAAEGATLIKQWIIRVTDKAFDDFAGCGCGRREESQNPGVELTSAFSREESRSFAPLTPWTLSPGPQACGAQDDTFHIQFQARL